MPHDQDEDFLRDILDACRLTREFLAGGTADVALLDDLRRSALLFQLVIIGEASGKVGLPLRMASAGGALEAAEGPSEHHR